MQFSINKAVFLKEVKRFFSKGKMNLKSKDEPNIKRFKICTFESSIVIVGGSIVENLFARVTIPAKIEEEGEVIDPELNYMWDVIDEMSGENIDIKFTEKQMIISDGVEESVVGLQALPDFPQVINDFDIMNFVDGDKVRFQHDKDENLKHDYIKWFTVTDKEINKVNSKIYNNVTTDILVLDTTDKGLLLEAKNEQLSRSFKKTYSANIYDKKRLSTLYLTTIFPSLSGENTFYYYVTMSGKLKIFVINESCQWLVSINEDIQ